MTYPTDKQIEAACDKEWELVQKWPLRSDERFVFMNKPNMREVLIAAREAEPPPTLEEFDVAFKHCLIVFQQAMGAFPPRNGTAEQTQKWVATDDDFMVAKKALRDLFVKAAGR